MRTSVTVLALCGAMAAQIPSVVDVPDCIKQPELGQLTLERNSLLSRHDQLKASTIEHNGKCNSVLAGSPQEPRCRSEQAQLQTQVSQYVSLVNSFNGRIERAKSACQIAPSSHPVIGAATNVRGTVYWLTSDGRRLSVTSGANVYFGARIVSGPESHAQLQLLDETVFTLGPNSDIVLDEFVYDPVSTVGNLTASIVKGTFRFVTGKLGHKEPGRIRIKLPVGVLGPRGTEFEVNYQPSTRGYVKLLQGQLQITETSTGRSFVLSAGESVDIEEDGSFSALSRPRF